MPSSKDYQEDRNMSAVNQTRLAWYALMFALLAGGPAAADPVSLPGGATLDQIDFERHVMGLLGRLGCNAGSCHGSFQGKGGLYLSLFGYSPEKDYFALSRDQLGRRINRVDPDNSLLLLKPTGQVAHGGGQRFARDSYPYQVLRAWIAQGARWQAGSGAVSTVRLEPAEHHFRKPGETHRFRVVAEFTGGTQEDVTSFSNFRVGDDYVAEIRPDGTVASLRPGDTSVIVTYRSQVATGHVLIPVPVEKGASQANMAETNYIDREVNAKLRKLNIVAAEQASDSEFLRRVYIDTIGTLPAPEEVRAFLADRDPRKRDRLIDTLLAHPMHAALWATKFSDITGNNVDVMENPAQLRPKRSKMWHDWFRVRVADNVPYDEIVRGVLCATSRDDQTPEQWVKASAAIEQAALKGFDTDYAERESLDLFWRRNNFTIQQMAEHTAAAFMGVRIECAQCHKHPFDRWTQTDYNAYANIFSQVRFGVSTEAKKAVDQFNAEQRKAARGNRNQTIQLREVFLDPRVSRRLTHPETRQAIDPRALGGPEFDSSYLSMRSLDAREALFQWLVAPENPYFARSFVNRVWAHYLGVGIVDPVDDFSVANPPSNAKLLDALAQDFVAHGYDLRHLERTILRSRTYQRSALPNASNAHDRRNFARSYPRRLMAEVVVDVLNSALGVTENYGNDVPRGIRAIEIAPNRVQSSTLNYVFRVFGRPPRSTTCDCERAMDPALPQTLYLMTDQTVLNKIGSGRLKQLLADKKTDAEIIEELFLAVYARFPTESEQRTVEEHLQAKGDRQAGFADLFWALINSREFILNH
jgi:hypothetical protein